MKNKKLTLKEILSQKLKKDEISQLPSSYDMVGDIIIFADFPEELIKKEKVIGEAYLEYFKNIQVVTKKVRKYGGRYRTPILRIIAGKRRKETIHKENNVRIRLNVEKVYFSPRSSNERQRITKQIKSGERVLVMFSGSGVYPIVISKNTQAKEIYGVEINPVAHTYAVSNLEMNKVQNVTLIEGDVTEQVPKISGRFDRILMPLPKGGEPFLEYALMKVKKGGIIHYYDFLQETEFDIAIEKVKNACKKAGVRCKILGIVKCGQYAPYTFRICVDFTII